MRLSRNDDQCLLSPLRIAYDHPEAIQRLAQGVAHWINQKAVGRPIVVVCVGTDRSTGDALGPLVGTRLKEKLAPEVGTVFGTLDEPVHAVNLSHTLTQIDRMHPSPFVIAVDACLGQVNSVGQISLHPGPLKPGAGVNKQLPPVGDIHVTGVVNVGGYMEYFVLQNTRLYLVVRMASAIAEGLSIGLSCYASLPASEWPVRMASRAPNGS
ncbi:MAG: spore protease YyaC [Alicyclobacillaceae bacterium]|nr:spore protease YyaC [Alicyclobacillaceae bacterium]